MDLKDVVSSVYGDSAEAHAAFHAGHNDKAEEYLTDIGAEIGTYLDEKTTPAGDVNESATSSLDEKAPKDKSAEVPGAPDQSAEEGPVLPASQFGVSQTDEKPTQ